MKPTAPSTRRHFTSSTSNKSLRQKRGMTTAMRKSMSFIPPPRGLGDEDDGPEMINASDQIKRVVDESCEIVKELEKVRLKLALSAKQSKKLKNKLAGRRNGLKMMREKVAMHALMGYVY